MYSVLPTAVMTGEKNGKRIMQRWEGKPGAEGEKVGRPPADERLCWGVLGPEIKENQGACVGGPRKQGLDVSNIFTLALEELW